MKNFEKYKDYLIKAIAVCNSDELLELAGIEYNLDYYGTKKSLVNWLLQDYKEPILEDGERKYLSAIIKPFKNNVIGITKVEDDYEKGKYYIRIIVRKHGKEYINLPWFDENTMYKGMKENKEYTVKELGLC